MKLWMFVLLLLLATSPARAEEPRLERFEFEEPHMGTRFRIVLYAPDIATAEKASKAAFARVAELNRIMSDYLATSELMRLCKKFETNVGEPVQVSKDLFFVLAKAQDMSKHSEGAFDVTVGPMVQLWRKARKTQKLPDPKELARAKELVGYQKMELNPKEQTLKLLVPGMQLDLGGIAKGYAADEALAAMQPFGIDRALVAAGGDIAVHGTPPGMEGWKIDIAPLPGTKDKRRLLLKDAAVSTSGDAEQFAVIDGVRYSHIVDPRTGLGLTGQRSVTVIARKGIDSDSLTKVASILPAEKALKLIEGLKGVETLIIVKNGAGEEVRKSKGFDRYLLKGE
jgi:thiamine biosynthesis lipoprotein